MKSHFLTTLVIASMLSTLNPLAWARQSDTVKIDRIIAIVDQAVITEQELIDRTKTLVSQIEKRGGKLPSEDVLQKQILERLIVDSLQLQLASQTGVKVDDAQLDKTIERIAEQNNFSLADFRKALEADGVNFRKFREDMRNEIIITRLREREVENRVNISEGEIDNYLTTQSNNLGENDDFEFSHILIRLPEDSSPEDLQKARAKTEQCLRSINEGMSFAEASATFSDAPNALEGGGMGWRTSSQIPGAFLEALKPLQIGETSKPFRSPSGVHILKLTDRRSGSAALLINQTRVRHILIKLSEVVSERDAKQKMDNIRERIENGTKFEEMARQYSEDGSASAGGELGWVNPGDTLPAFEQTMNELGLGEISQPVKTPFGWHIIQVLERREQDMSKEAARLKARQEIRARKAEEAYEDWIREMRDKAFVELRLDDKF